MCPNFKMAAIFQNGCYTVKLKNQIVQIKLKHMSTCSSGHKIPKNYSLLYVRCFVIKANCKKGHWPLRIGSKFELGPIFTSNTSNLLGIGRKKSRVAKTGASQKQYHFWNPCNQTSNLRYYLPTLGPSSNFEFERKGQRPFNILPYNSVTKHPISGKLYLFGILVCSVKEVDMHFNLIWAIWFSDLLYSKQPFWIVEFGGKFQGGPQAYFEELHFRIINQLRKLDWKEWQFVLGLW